MIIIIEGLDRVGKDTQIKLLQTNLVDKPCHIFHYSAIKNIDNKFCKKYSKKLYNDGFKIIGKLYKNRHLIFNRFLLGETVYSPIYRKYSGDYIYKLEQKYQKKDFFKEIYLITIIDDVDNLLKREDGLSFSIDPTKKQKEIDGFTDAYNRSNIVNKKLININNKSIDEVHLEICDFLKI